MISRKFNLISKQRKNNSDQFIPRGNNSFSIDHSLVSFHGVIIFKDTIMANDRTGNQIPNPFQADNSPFGNSTSFDHVSRLFYTGISFGISNQLFRAGKAMDIFHFTQEVTGRCISNTFNG